MRTTQAEQQVDVKLVNVTRYYVGFVLGVLAMMSILCLAVGCISQQERGVLAFQVAFGAAFVGSGVVPFFLWKRWAVSPAVVTIGTDRLTVDWLNADEPITILFANVRTYGTTSSRTWASLRFTLTDGTRERFATDEWLAPSSNFWEMVQAVNVAAAQYRAQLSQNSAEPKILGAQLPRPRAAAMSRERGFFEKRSSTVIFICLTAVMGLGLIVNALKGQRVGPLLAMSLGAWVLYLLPWLLGMDERRRNAENNKN